MPIEWSDLPQTFRHHPQTKPQHAVKNRYGADITPATEPADTTFRGCLQTVRAQLAAQSEGFLSKASHFIYCNPTPDKGSKTPLTMMTGDEIEDARGVRYRVEYVDAPAGSDGQADHYKVYVSTVGPQGDAR